MGMPRVPAPDEDALHIHSHTAGSVGPISRKALATRLADGLVPPGAFVWVDGMPGWEPLDDHRAALVDALVDTVIAPPDPAQPAPAPAPAPAAEPAPANGGGHALVAEVPTLVEAAPAASADERNPGNEAGETAPSEPATPWTGAAGDSTSAEPPATTVAPTSSPTETATAGATDTETAPEPATAATEATAAATEPVSAPAPDAAPAVPPAGAEAGNAAEPTRAEAQPAQPAPAEAEPADPDAVFGALVRDSWQYLERQRRAAHLDDVFVGAVITSTLDTGYALIDLESDGTHHYLRFEDLADRSRIVCRLSHLTPSVAVARVVGQRVSAVIGYGERVKNIGKIWSAISAEMKSSYLQEAEPGTITVDGDAQSGYVYAQVDLFLDLDRYVAEDYAIDYARLSAHVGATTQALRKYLRGRFA